MRHSTVCLPLSMLLALGACKAPEPAPTKAAATTGQAFTTTPSGLGILDLQVGEGVSPRVAQTCVVEVSGWIEEAGAKGRQFLDTRKRGYPATFPLGVGRVIAGWEQGIATMKKGGRRLLRVPPSLGYSEKEAGDDIPPGSTLLFEVQLVDLR
ncbi:FKBP-type peptidyl-prolyl cis-trans isomerase [Geothrix sp. PMB-07]|uniref:FKBP-type peptidyl-prolyl cis-trans isomerase n=1 Tax=Geothrix sp. PMB-07 TaxID=3068640 RepID=UPI002740DF1D|nr:FKBP-type peptidyl-prolyl cis-trans isomerase [Geothrix sp. PMB-07]WLT32295.1 FKBP-type peptidyl-prolyl cis-trans isomerase [Geothrix sp. PMB-07]